MDTIDLMLYLMWGGMGAVVLFLIAWWFIVQRQYRYVVQIREVANGRKIIQPNKAREFYDEKGVKYLRLQKAPKKRRLMSFPPEEAVELDNKGRKHVIVYLTEGGDYRYAYDKVKEGQLYAASADDRNFLASQIRRAEERKPTKWTDHIITITGGMVLIVFVVSVLLFGGEFVQQVSQPAITLGEKLEYSTNNMLKIQESLERIERDIQVLQEENTPQGGAPN